MQRMRTMLTTLFHRRSERQPTTTIARLDADLQSFQHGVEILWWYWRHYFLEMKRLQLEAHTDRSDS